MIPTRLSCRRCALQVGFMHQGQTAVEPWSELRALGVFSQPSTRLQRPNSDFIAQECCRACSCTICSSLHRAPVAQRNVWQLTHLHQVKHKLSNHPLSMRPLVESWDRSLTGWEPRRQATCSPCGQYQHSLSNLKNPLEICR